MTRKMVMSYSQSAKLVVVKTVSVDDSLVDVGKCIAVLHVGLLTTEQLYVTTFVGANHETFHKEDLGVWEVDDNAGVQTLAKKSEVRIGCEGGTTVHTSPSCTGSDCRAPCWTKSIEWNLASLSTLKTRTTTRVQIKHGQLLIDSLEVQGPPSDCLRKMKNTPSRIVGGSTWRNLTRHDD